MVDTAVLRTSSVNAIPDKALGTIDIRVVILAPKPKKAKAGAVIPGQVAAPDDADEEDLLFDEGATPVSSYLESGRGKRCCVFLINGQRQESLDNSFIVQDLGFKYLRNRMMIVVDLDGLSPEAIAHLMRGDRQSLYRGEVWNAITRRITATLKNDPDLEHLE